MQIRALQNTPISTDLTPPIPPIAASLHDQFLPSHCSSCFLPLPPTPLSCSSCFFSLHYCSPACSSADSPSHLSTGECRLLSLHPPSPSTDLRAAIRLIHSLPLLSLPRRIGGLLAEAMAEGGEMAERVREGAGLIARARNSRVVGGGLGMEEAALWAVMVNGVEVEDVELGGIGVAVYGPWFSWFNHGCAPNACYRFEVGSGIGGFRRFDLGAFRVFPDGGDGEALDVWKTWNYVENLCWFGPRIVIRNIKPLKKDDEVCIAYMDLLQTKASRHFDLWSRYRFVCHCERCCISPPMYIDYILSCDARKLNLENHCCCESEWMDVSDYLEEAIAEYMLDGNPEVCCRKLEIMLCDSFDCKPSDALESRFRLHPLHFLSLKTYIVLSSAYRIQACNIAFIDLSVDDSKNFKMAKAAAACSLLIACATHHLFMSEFSILPNCALFWIGAAESILYLVRIARSLGQFAGLGFKMTLVGSHCAIESQAKSQEDLLVASTRFIDNVSLIMINLWPFLAQGHPYMECIENPANFGLLLIPNSNQHCKVGSNAGYGRQEFSGSKYGELDYIVEWNGLHQLAVCCLMYSRYLANVCHGPDSQLSGKVDDLERILKEIAVTSIGPGEPDAAQLSGLN